MTDKDELKKRLLAIEMENIKVGKKKKRTKDKEKK
jgi:hypothetical protein